MGEQACADRKENDVRMDSWGTFTLIGEERFSGPINEIENDKIVR